MITYTIAEASEKDIAQLKKFIEELEALEKKYHMQIGGCGCCGSPFIEKGKFNKKTNMVDWTELAEDLSHKE